MTAVRDPIGRNIISKAGFEPKRVIEEEKDGWKAYAVWCGQTRERRIWGEMVSNSMWVVKEFLVYKSGERMKQFEDEDNINLPSRENDTSSFEDLDLDLDLDLDEDDFIMIDAGTMQTIAGASVNNKPGEDRHQEERERQQERQGTPETRAAAAVEELERRAKIPKAVERGICLEVSSKQEFEAKLSMYRGCCTVCTARSGKSKRGHT
jgi:hypothetical protein